MAEQPEPSPLLVAEGLGLVIKGQDDRFRDLALVYLPFQSELRPNSTV